jgi:hypothetical protein
MTETTPTPAKSKSMPWWRRSVPWVFLVLATIVVILSALTVFVKRDALSTDHWTSESSQILEDPAVQNALSIYLVNQLYSRVDVTAAIQEQLPDKAKPLAGPIAATLQEVSLRAARTLLARPATLRLWRTANRLAHSELIAVLDGHTDRLSTTHGNVVLDVRPILQKLGDSALGKKLLPHLPPTAGQIVILRSNQLKTAQTATKVLRALSILLTLVALALYVAAVWLSPARRRMLFWVGISGVFAGLLILVARRAGGNYLIDSLTGDMPNANAAAHSVWAIATTVLRNIGLTILVYGIGIMLAAVLAGPTRAATTVRRWLAPTLEARPLAAFGAVVLAFLLLLLFGPTDAQRLVPLAALCGFALLGVEALRRQTRREFAPAEPAA